MLCAIDLGNTDIVVGLYRERELVRHWRLSTDRNRTADEFGIILHNLFSLAGIDLGELDAVCVASSVPPLTPAISEMCEQYLGLKPLVVGPGIKTGIVIKYDNPKEIGADRIADSIAAFELYGGPVVVVDFGTATAFDVISADGVYLGGALAPGITTSTEALFVRAAKLPRIDIGRPKSVIGKNTVASMQAGIVFGFAGQVDAIVRRIIAELGAPVRVVATGPFAELIAADSETIETVNPLLTLEGLRIVHERNL
ncbi:MAG TPA: type III pantothenate kinase [Bacillota bacterium]|jgi:type III pantothenate kinase